MFKQSDLPRPPASPIVPSAPSQPRPRRFPVISAVVLSTSLLLGCSGGNDPSADAGTGGDAASAMQEACSAGFLPLKTGVKWTYSVRDVTGGGVEMKETTVEELMAVPMVPGQMAYKVRTRKGGSLADETVSWQQRTASGQIARYQEQAYKPGVGGGPLTAGLSEWWDPYKLRIDETRLRRGDIWTVTYKEFARDNGVDSTPRDRNERWEVLAVNDPITVPAGTYKALKLRRVGTDQNATSDKQYWFACGVGKVRESGAGGRFEELIKVEGL